MPFYFSKHFAISVSREFAATPSEVFAGMNDDSSFFALRPNATAHDILETHGSGGHSCRSTYKTKMGRTVELTATSIEFVPNSHQVDQCVSASGTAHVTTTYRPTDSGTLVSIQYDFTCKRRYLGWLTRQLTRYLMSRQYNAFFDRLEAVVTASQ